MRRRAFAHRRRRPGRTARVPARQGARLRHPRLLRSPERDARGFFGDPARPRARARPGPQGRHRALALVRGAGGGRRVRARYRIAADRGPDRPAPEQGVHRPGPRACGHPHRRAGSLARGSPRLRAARLEPLESALQLRGEGGEELLRDRGLVPRAGEHPPDGGFDGPRLQRVDLAAPRGEREEGAPGIVRIALPGEDPAGLEPAEDSGQRARVHAEDLREGPRRDARGASHYAHHQPLRPRDAVRRFQPFRDRLETVVDGPELLHELEDGTEVRAFLACSVRAAGVGRFRSCAQGRHRMRGERSLNSGVPAVRNREKRTVSVLVTTAPAFSQRFSPTCRFSSVRDTIASFGTKTSKPLPTRSRTVWNTQTCDSIPTAITCRRPVASTCPATALEFAQENSIFSMGGEGSSSRMAATVGPSPLTYCSLATTGHPSRRAALMRMAAFFSIRASASGGMARASFSCTSTTRSKALSRSRTRFAASDGIALGSALGGGAGVETHVDTGHLPGGECALEGRPDPGRILDVLAVSSERFDHLVVARRSEQRRGTLLGAEEVELGKSDLPPGSVVADHAHHGKTEAHGGLEIHAVQAEAPVALDDEGRPRRVEELRRDREGRADAETPERSRIEP